MTQNTSIKEIFLEAKKNQTYVKVCAPMVRYSKVHFRTLVRNYGVDLCFTPMILADSFCQNSKARLNEFATTDTDSPLVVQFAANSINDFLDASHLVYPYADGIDLNCGCPQRWAMKDGYGCALLSKPELIYDMVSEIRNNLPTNFSVSVKVRIMQDLKKSIIMCQQLEKCGVDFVTVHGRTPTQKSGDSINVESLKLLCEMVDIPVIANGGIKTLNDADQLFARLNCGGIMAASGILTNPALFSGEKKTPVDCIKMWMALKNKNKDKITFQCYHHHLVFMLEKFFSRQQKQEFNILNTFESVDDFLTTNILDDGDHVMQLRHDLGEFITCQFDNRITSKHSCKCRLCGKSLCYCICSKYDPDVVDGKYFASCIQNSDELDFMDTNIFEEPLVQK